MTIFLFSMRKGKWKCVVLKVEYGFGDGQKPIIMETKRLPNTPIGVCSTVLLTSGIFTMILRKPTTTMDTLLKITNRNNFLHSFLEPYNIFN